MSPKRPLALFLAQPSTTAFNGPAFPTANTPRHNVPRLLCLRCITLSTPQLRSDTNSRGPRQDGAPLPTTFEELLFLLQQRTTINLQRRLARWPVRWSCFLATSAVVVKEYRSMCVLKACLSASVAVHTSAVMQLNKASQRTSAVSLVPKRRGEHFLAQTCWTDSETFACPHRFVLSFVYTKWVGQGKKMLRKNIRGHHKNRLI